MKNKRVYQLFVEIINQKEFGVGKNHIDVYDKNLEDKIQQLPPKQHDILLEKLRGYLIRPVLISGGMR